MSEWSLFPNGDKQKHLLQGHHYYRNKQTNKQKNKQTKQTIYIYKCIFFFMIYKLQAYILYNIYNIVVIMVKNNKKLKNYLHRGPCTPYLSRDREIA